jgi:F0F1-type ATP synthase assembly protein I
MPEPSKPTMRAASAGSMLVAAIVLCALIGYGLGALIGAPVPLLLVGLFVGPIVGVLVVRSRFRDL